MHRAITYLALLLALIVGVIEASQYSRDESSEDSKTEFNLASTLTGGISSNRHHARAHLNSQLGTQQIGQQPFRQPSAGFGSADIDAPSAHENGGSGVGTLDVHLSPGGNRVGGTTSLYPALPIEGQPQSSVGHAIAPSAAPSPYPNAAIYPSFGPNYPNGGQQPGYPVGHPGFAYPGQYLPQYPATYPTYPAYPAYAPVQPGNIPVVVHPAQPPPPATSYQNQQQFAPNQTPRQRDHWNRSFTMNTEYKEDGVHKGPFEVLNNHNKPGYGSGFGGGYNGAFNRPGY